MKVWLLFYFKHLNCPVVVEKKDKSEADILSELSSDADNVSYTLIPVVGRYIDLPFPHFVFHEKKFRYIVGYSESLEETWG